MTKKLKNFRINIGMKQLILIVLSGRLRPFDKLDEIFIKSFLNFIIDIRLNLSV